MKRFDIQFAITTFIAIAMLIVMALDLRLSQREAQREAQPQTTTAPVETAAPPSSETGWPDLSPYWPIGVMVLLIGVNTAILLRRGKGLGGTTKRATLPYPTVEIFEHAKASPDVAVKVRLLFEKAGYRVNVLGNTNLPQHAQGVHLIGGTSTDRTQAIWGLATIPVTPEPYQGTDDPEKFQVIVGAYDAKERGSGKEIEELRTDVRRITNERDGALQAYERCSRNFTMERLAYFARECPDVKVMIRSAGYNPDWPLVQEIEKLFKEKAKWIVDTDPNNVPPLKPNAECKVVIGIGDVDRLYRLHSLLSPLDGGLLKVPVCMKKDVSKFTPDELLVEVLPTVNSGA